MTRNFLVHTVVPQPEELRGLDNLKIRERSRAHDLQRIGTLRFLWREKGRLASFGLWTAESEELVWRDLMSLPAFPFMEASVSEIEPHPNALHQFPV